MKDPMGGNQGIDFRGSEWKRMTSCLISPGTYPLWTEAGLDGPSGAETCGCWCRGWRRWFSWSCLASRQLERTLQTPAAHERTWTVSAMTALSLNHSATSRKAPVCCSYRIFLSDPKFRRIHHQQDSNMRGKYILFRHFNVMWTLIGSQLIYKRQTALTEGTGFECCP